MREFKFQGGQSGAAITVKVTPRAKGNELTGLLSDGTLQMRVTAPPADGQANAAVVKLLAEVLRVGPSQIEIVAGHSAPKKLVSILGLAAAEVDSILRAALNQRGKRRIAR